LHVVLRVFGGGAAGWRTTFRVIAYLGGAWLLGSVAWFLVASRLTSGGLASGGTPYLAALTYFVLLARALALAHVDPGWKPALAMVVMLVLGCCTGCLAMVAALVPFFTPLGG
jgi:hypothetical protein